MRSIMGDAQIRGATPDLFAFAPFPLCDKAREISAGSSRQSCVLEASATFPTSLGLMAAACMRTRVSPSSGSGIATSSICNTDGGPNAANRNAFILVRPVEVDTKRSPVCFYMQIGSARSACDSGEENCEAGPADDYFWP